MSDKPIAGMRWEAGGLASLIFRETLNAYDLRMLAQILRGMADQLDTLAAHDE